ncbi:MAG: DinB family protein [Acidobacteriia bacterium]|nr:DinB family protein [Terriglobia bacterium]
MTPEEIRLLYQYNSWANHRLLDACAALSAEQFTRDLHASFPSVRDTLVHIMDAERIWQERFQGRFSTPWLAAAQFPDLAALRSQWSKIEEDLLRFVSPLTPEELARVRDFPNLQGQIQALPLWQPLQHLVNHGSYHRGQVVAFLRQLDAKGVSLDLIRFYRERAAGAAA